MATTAVAADAAAATGDKKFGKFAANIFALTERTRLAREELEKMSDVTSQLREQCELQERETANLEKEQSLAREEVEGLKKRIEGLTAEKSKIEQKLEELRVENAKLDSFVRQHELYSLLWKDVDLSKYLVAAAPFGGPIAMIRMDRKLLALQSQSSRPVMHFFTSSGKLIHQFQWDKGRIVGMGWTSTEELLCVLEHGYVRVFNLHGEYTQFSMGQDAKEYGIADCHIWCNGVIVLTGNNCLVVVTDLSEPKPKNLADPGAVLQDQPHSWAIIPPHQTLSRHLEVLIAVDHTVIQVDATNVVDQRLENGPYIRMALSPNGKFLALYNAEGRVWVVSSDFQKHLADFPTNSTIPPLQMAWCGSDAVVLHWEDTVLVVGPFGDWIKYSVDGVACLVSEIDGMRIICADKCFFLQRVPSATEDVFKIGSTTPGAILYDSLDHFEKGNPRADENIRNIKGNLIEAVETCLEAASHEFDTQRQKTLLRVRKSVGDSDQLCKIIVEKMGSEKMSISFAEIAKTAYQTGQTKLATQLLDYEPKAANQVPLLMSMDQDSRALVKAIDSGDTDLVYAVILHMKRKHPIAEFFRLLHGKTLATNLLETYSKQQDMQLLKDFYYQDDRRTERANVMFTESFEQSQLNARLAKLKESLKLFQEDKERTFEVKAIEDQIKLLQAQSAIERDTGHSFFNLTVSQTIYKLLILGHGNRAAKLKSDLKVPEKRYLWIKARVLVEQRNWEGLDKFIKSSTKFVSLAAIVELLIKSNELQQAKVYAETLAKTPAGAQEGNAFLALISNATPR
ncbi:hypothetical protein HDV05_005345 [Chytridiales sp. JEL 0842]|nr:hypothetical protein HDV05_005345 [Chytridiales sp. JEL 0842]